MSDVPREFVFTRYPARQGLVWLKAAYVMFKARRLAWIMLILAYVVVAYFITLVLLGPFPFAVPYVLTVLKPVFDVGLLAAAWTQERGGTPHISQMLQGFRANFWALLAIGAFLVAGLTLAVLASSLVDDGTLLDLLASSNTPADPQADPRLADPMLKVGVLLTLALSIPVAMAAWWAPALVVFQDASAGGALATSLRAWLANWKPLLSYWIAVFFYGALVPRLLYALILALVPAPAGEMVALVLVLSYSLVFAAVLRISDYVSYRDVFHSGETLAPLSRQT